jgi:hypothetical protein
MTAPAFVQENDNSSSPGATVAVTFGSANTAGNFIVLAFNTTPPDVSITDTLGNTYTVAVTDGSGLTLAYAWNIKAGSNTVTARWSVSNFYAFAALEWSGVKATADPLGATNFATGTSALANAGAVTPTSANDLVVAVFEFGNGGIAAGGGFTIHWNFNFGSNFETDGLAPNTSPITPTATCTSGAWHGATAIFKVAPPASPIIPTGTGPVVTQAAGW